MNRLLMSAGAAVALTSVALVAAPKPRTLAGVAPGLWELTGVPGAKAPVHECLGNVAALAQYEHKGKGCSATTISDNGKVVVINYTCAGSDFGRSSIKLVTPRTLRIDTQGISGGLPFAYVIDARRIGDCKAGGLAPERGH